MVPMMVQCADDRVLVKAEAATEWIDLSRFVGGTMLDFGQASPHRFALNEERSRPGAPVYYTPEELRRDWPKRTRIRLVQIEEDRYLSVIGEDFGCNGDRSVLRLPDGPHSAAPRFPRVHPDELVFLGANEHEWHLVPEWEP